VKCPHCGIEAHAKATYCTSCGGLVASEDNENPSSSLKKRILMVLRKLLPLWILLAINLVAMLPAIISGVSGEGLGALFYLIGVGTVVAIFDVIYLLVWASKSRARRK
jgi:uncharacterized membrane protein